MKTVLFVCTGNTCRSSMAEAIFKEMLKDIKDVEIEVFSAGTWALEGNNASVNAIEVMKEKSIDLSGHSSTPLGKDLIDKADLILTMTRNHRKQILSAVPQAKNKVYTLKEFARLDSLDIMDPYGGDIEIYRKCANEIENALEIILEKILNEE